MVGIVITDGTGWGFFDLDEKQYDLDYGKSHCSVIGKMFPNTIYRRGPTITGNDMGPIVQDTIYNAHRFCVTPECKGLILIGHSRGGAAVIAAAQKLNQEGVTVDYMGLFDAVEMDYNMSYDVDCIPANVKAVRHGERMFSTASRPLWGNCGDAWSGGSNFKMPFWGTHGSLGGVPPPLTSTNGDDRIWEDGFHPTRVTIRDGHSASRMIGAWIIGGIQDTLKALESRRPEDWERGDYGKKKPGSWLPPHPGNGNGGGTKPPGGGSGGKEQFHVVKSGESLSLIAGQYWGDVLLWPVIYHRNEGQIENPNVIQINQRFAIPDISGYSKSKLEQIRAEGRNWRR